MFRQLTAVVLVPFALLLGCAALHHPAPMPTPPRASELRHELASWVVGVREPEIRYSAPDVPGPDVLDEVRDAVHLVNALRDTGLFAKVDFTHQLACPPTIELVVRASKEERLRWGPLWPTLLTLSLGTIDAEEGVVFSPAGDPNTVFEFPYPTILVVGVLPLLASPVLITGALPTWSFMGIDPVHQQLKRFILRNAERLKAFAQHPEPGRCSVKKSAPHLEAHSH